MASSPSSAGSQPTPDREMVESLRRAGLLNEGQAASFVALDGGVASDIWKVTSGAQVFCVKRALPKLKVAADWFVPVERNRFEVAWYEIADGIVPGSAPRVLAHDEGAMLFAMEYLEPAAYRNWKHELRDGRADPTEAAEVGRRLGRIHAGTAANETIAARFPRTDIFHAIRLMPYLEATAERHPDLADRLFHLSRRTGETRRVMIHGDVSPKNILLGPDGPVFIDAECACIGDPVFDLDFCLKHFLLKCLWVPDVRDGFLACYAAMVSAYLAEVTWEDADALEARAASLLPGMFLGRVDGMSPVEYVTAEADKDKVRRCARALLAAPPDRLSQVAEAWQKELAA